MTHWLLEDELGRRLCQDLWKTWASTSLKTNESWNLEKNSHLKTWIPWPQDAKTLSFLGFHVNSLGGSAGSQRPRSNSHCLEKAFIWVGLRWQNRAWDVWHDVLRWSSVMSFDWTDWGSSRFCMVIYIYSIYNVHCVSTCFNSMNIHMYALSWAVSAGILRSITSFSMDMHAWIGHMSVYNYIRTCTYVLRSSNQIYSNCMILHTYNTHIISNVL